MLVHLQSRWLRWRRRFSRAEWCARHFGFALSQDPPHARGVLLIQIDGLGRRQLERAIKSGRMPFLRALLRRHGHELHTHYSGMPSSTPAVQAELHYGVRTAVPAFSFLDRESGSIAVMMYPTVAKRVEATLKPRGEGLLRGGSSWSNIYTGGAAPEESHFCAASIGLGDAWRSLRLRLVLLVLLMHLDIAFRLIGLLVAELGIGLWDALHGVFRQGRRARKELAFLVARVAVCVGLRELVTVGASIDLARGLPVIHVNFLGYDEQAHRRGPDSAFAHWALRGIDRSIRLLYHAARRSQRRDYEVWVFSDHGQVGCQQAEKHIDGGLEELVRRHWPEAGAKQRGLRRQLRPSPGHWLGGAGGRTREAHHTLDAQLSAFEQEEYAIAAMGPVGHVYFGRDIGTDQARRLAAALVRDGVPGVLWRDGRDEVVWLEAGGEHRLPRDASLFDVDSTLRPELARDLVALCHHPRAGDLVILGWAPGRVPWSFAMENGSHAGPARDEVLGFALLPVGTWLPGDSGDHIRPETLRRAALHALGRDSAADAARSVPRRRAPRPAPLRILTYNVHGCLGADGRVSPLRVARILDRYDADIIALQEIDLGRSRSRGEDQLGEIARELGMEAAFCSAVGYGAGHYGHGLLARVPFTVERQGMLPGAGGRREPRVALRVAVPWHGRTIRVISTHLGLSRDERWLQVNELLGDGWAGENDGTPVVLCGDLNLHPGSRAYRQLAGRLRDVQSHAPGHVARRTFPAVYPVRCLDYVFVSAHFDVQGVFVPRDALTLVTSDHLPLGCDLAFA